MGEKVEKPYEALVMCGEGKTLHHKGYLRPQEARRKVERMMTADPSANGKVIFTKVLVGGKPMEEVVSRNSAFSAVFPKGVGAVMERKKAGNTANVMRARNSHASFSRG